MSDWKPLIFSLVIIFAIGLVFTLVLSPLVEIESEIEEQSTWVNPFIFVGKAIIDILSLPLVFVAEFIEGVETLFEGVTNILDSPFSFLSRSTADEDDYTFAIEVTGTGTHDEHTLDGTYIFLQSISGRAMFESIDEGYYENKTISRLNRIEVFHNSTEDVTRITLQTIALSWWRRLFRQYRTIYEDNSPSNDSEDIINFSLVVGDLDYNSNAEGVFIIEGLEEFLETKTNYGQEAKKLIDELKDIYETNLRVFGLIPAYIGLPILLILLLSLLYGVIKLMPFT